MLARMSVAVEHGYGRIAHISNLISTIIESFHEKQDSNFARRY